MKLRKATISFAISVCLSVYPSARNNSAHTGRIFMKFDIWVFFKILSMYWKFHLNLTRISGTFTWRHVYIYRGCW